MDFALILEDLKNMQIECNERRISSASKWYYTICKSKISSWLFVWSFCRAAEMQFYVYENVDETIKSHLNMVTVLNFFLFQFENFEFVSDLDRWKFNDKPRECC